MILTLYARAPLLCVDSVSVCALPPSVVRATEVSLAQTEIAFITLYEPASTTARVLSRLAVAAHHATTHGLGTTTRNQPVEASRKARESCGSGSDSAPLRRKGALPCPL